MITNTLILLAITAIIWGSAWVIKLKRRKKKSEYFRQRFKTLAGIKDGKSYKRHVAPAPVGDVDFGNIDLEHSLMVGHEPKKAVEIDPEEEIDLRTLLDQLKEESEEVREQYPQKEKFKKLAGIKNSKMNR